MGKFIPLAFFHGVFCVVGGISAGVGLLFSYIFVGSAFTRYSILIAAIATVNSCFLICHIASNLIMFAGHGDLLSLGQKEKIFPNLRPCPRIEPDLCIDHPIVIKSAVTYKSLEFSYNKENNYYLYLSPVVNGGSTIVFLHGNGVPACCFASFIELIHEFHPVANIAAIEYRGYGKRSRENASVYDLKGMRADVSKAWRDIATKVNPDSMIIAGLSLGGGFAWSTIDILYPAPKQLVLINTFADLGAMLRNESEYYYPIISLFMPTAITKYRLGEFHSSWKGSVLCVYTQNDSMFPPMHKDAFKIHFKDTKGCDWQEFMCPNGDHNGGPVFHQQWLKLLKVGK